MENSKRTLSPGLVGPERRRTMENEEEIRKIIKDELQAQIENLFTLIIDQLEGYLLNQVTEIVDQAKEALEAEETHQFIKDAEFMKKQQRKK